MTEYNNTNRFSLWARDKGPVTYSGIIDVEGTTYNLKFLRLAKEPAKAALMVCDAENDYAVIGCGFLYPSKFEEMMLSGKLNVQGASYYVNFYKNEGKSEKSPTFSGNIKPADEQATATKTPTNKSTEDDW